MQNPPPRLTSAQGCGGRIRVLTQDFVVEEIPAYSPSGDGEHLFLWVEKSGMDTPQLARLMARELELPEREVSYAGLKDRQALTSQFYCVPARVEGKVPTLHLAGAKVHRWVRHRNKLRTGHLRGNRFQVRIREVHNPEAATAVLAELRRTGFPNYFGPQRFGATGNNAALGKGILLGKSSGVSRFERKLYLSAYQSLLFNRLLAARIEQGTLEHAMLGDVMQKMDSGGIFLCEDPSAEQARLERFEISPTGPLFGPKMPRPGGEVAEREDAVLRAEGLTLEGFSQGRGETAGGRRAYRLPLGNPGLRQQDKDLWISFELPKGSYATVVLHELMGD
jgi:tRNA pseudouridine13 synthase